MRLRRTFAFAATVLAMVLGAVAPAFASHFRASYGAVTYDSNTTTMTWTIEEAWRHGSDDTFFGQGSTVAVTTFPAEAATCASLNVTSAAVDTSDPLFDRTTEVMSGDLSCLAAGQYTIWGENCCRVAGVFNTSGNNSFSQRIVFTKNGNGSIDMPPVFNHPSLYVIVAVGGPGDTVTIDYTAADPELAGPVTYAQLTSVTSPDWGAAALPCSSFTAGVLTIGPSLCQGAENFATDYPAGRFYAAKVRATDANGNTAEVDTLLRVPTAPSPQVDSDNGQNGPTTFTLTLADSDTATPTSWSLSCTDRADNSVLTGTAPGGADASIELATVLGHTYDCVPSATNVVGSNNGPTYVFTAVDHAPTPTVQTSTGSPTSTTFHVVQPYTGITTPTSWTITCTNQANGADVQTGTTTVTAMAADVEVTGLTLGQTYNCVPTAVNGVGTGTGPTYVLHADATRTPEITGAVPGTSTTFSLGLLAGPGGAPTAYGVVCTDDSDSSTHSGTSATSDVTVSGLVAGHTYTCVPSATNAGGIGHGAPFSLSVPSADRGGYTAQAPVRLADTRDGTGGAPVGPLLPGNVLRVPVRSFPGVPQDVSAVTITVTTDNAAAPGFVTVFPCDAEGVPTSNVNFEPDRQVANLVAVAVDANGDVCVSSNQAVEIMVDLTGVFSSSGDYFDAVVPYRAADTRVDGDGSKLAGGTTLVVDFSADAHIPAGASSVVLNVTGTESDENGFVTVWPCEQERPLASSLNLTPGREIPVLVTAKLDGTRKVCAYSQSTTHLVVDVTGYFAQSAEDKFVPVTPARLVDTRTGNGAEQRKLVAGETLMVAVAGNGGVVAGASAVALNVTMTNADGPGFLTAYPCDAERPLASNVNATVGSDTPNAVVIKVPTAGDHAGHVCLYTMISTDLVVDVTGYFKA